MKIGLIATDSLKSAAAAAAFVVLFFCGTQNASATVTFYTSQSAFTTAAGTTSSFGFNNLASGSNTVGYGTASGLTDNGITFVGTTGNPAAPYWLSATGPTFYGSDYDHVPGTSSLQGPALTSSFYAITNGVLTITMPAGGVTAFGVDVFDVETGTVDGSGTDSVNLNVGTATDSVVTPQFTGVSFIGFTSTTPITSITLTGTANEEFPDITEVFFVTTPVSTSAVPEPSAFGLAALGGLGLAFGLFKRASFAK